jgi:hypothetical protein
VLLALMAAPRAGAGSQEAGKGHLKEHLSIWAVCPQELFEHLSSLLIKPKHLSWLPYTGSWKTFPGTLRMMIALKKEKEKAGVQLEKDRERTLGLPVTSPAPPPDPQSSGGCVATREACMSLRFVDKPTRCCSIVSSSRRAA